MAPDDWVRVTPDEPCPVCGRGDWCLTNADGTAAICPRTESPKRCGDAGWLHRLGDETPAFPHARRFVLRAMPPPADLTALAERYRMALTPDRRTTFAHSLGLSAGSLAALRLGWSVDHKAYSFPMTDPATGRIVGIRLRAADGAKFAVAGGKDGLFIPDVPRVADEPLLVTEGATDTAALLDMGFPNVVGRPSCTGGIKHVVMLVQLREANAVVVLGDGDEPGRRGAENLASLLRIYVPVVRVVEPPVGVKDMRAWRSAGAMRADLEELIAAAVPRRLAVRFIPPKRSATGRNS